MIRLVVYLELLFVWLVLRAEATSYNILNQGAISNNDSITVCNQNTFVMNKTLKILQPGDILEIPMGYEFWFNGNIYGENISSATIEINGAMKFQNSRDEWPTDDSGHVKECMHFINLYNVTFTSKNKDKGLIDGNGNRWWGAIKYLIDQENRPRLMHIYNSQLLKVENLFFKNSPYWNFFAEDINGLEISFTNVSARREPYIDYHDLYDITAFNTDGFDVSGKNVYIHDCEIWNDDDCIAVKSANGNSLQSNCSENMLFERINASGLGLTIGSLGPDIAHNCIRNITFRNGYMYRTFKGIYLKSTNGDIGGTGEIKDILYENIIMDEPTQVPIWIGPQQAVYTGACSLLWPEVPFEKCPVPSQVTWQNIKLVNVTVNNPRQSPGVILGNITNPMMNVTFVNVVVNNPGKRPWGSDFYCCDGVNGTAIGDTNPKPPCFATK